MLQSKLTVVKNNIKEPYSMFVRCIRAFPKILLISVVSISMFICLIKINQQDEAIKLLVAKRDTPQNIKGIVKESSPGRSDAASYASVIDSGKQAQPGIITTVKIEQPEHVTVKDGKSPDIKLNKCPPHYTFPANLFSKYDRLKQVSSYTLSNRSSTKYNFKQTMAVLVPVSNSEPFLLHFFRLMCSLTYPHELMTIVFGEDSSTDDTYNMALTYAKELLPYFRNISVYRFDIKNKKPPGVHRHSTKYQLPRRMHMAKSRNLLLSKGLTNEDVALWIDVDVKYYPRDIIQHMLSEDKDVITPACMQVGKKGIGVYDLNNWQDTKESLIAIKNMDENYLRVESSGIDIKRKYLHSLSSQSHVVPLDGVGGCLLMVKARCHRLGLNFPTFIYKNQIETEGLALFAKKMGFSVYGLPNVTILHTIR